MTGWYNEIDSYCVAWLRALVAADELPAGTIDARPIETLSADDVSGRGHRHFFAGIGGWPLALRLAGVPDDATVWSGSCPCQPFAHVSRRTNRGFDDPRHLWPAWHRLIDQCRPPVVVGEQVASVDGVLWFAHVQADLERSGYAVVAADLPAAGVGAPHLRQRLFFAARRLADPDADDVRWLRSIHPGGQGARLRHDAWTETHWPSFVDGVHRPIESRAAQVADGIPGLVESTGAVTWLPGQRDDGAVMPLIDFEFPGRSEQIGRYGNGIVIPLAATFARAALEVFAGV